MIPTAERKVYKKWVIKNLFATRGKRERVKNSAEKCEALQREFSLKSVMKPTRSGSTTSAEKSIYTIVALLSAQTMHENIE